MRIVVVLGATGGGGHGGTHRRAGDSADQQPGRIQCLPTRPPDRNRRSVSRTEGPTCRLLVLRAPPRDASPRGLRLLLEPQRGRRVPRAQAWLGLVVVSRHVV